MNNLLIVGAGQYGIVTKEIAESMNFFDNISFLDDNSSNAIDRIENYKKYINEYKYLVIAIGNSDVRSNLFNKFKDYFVIAKIISPHAYISPSAFIDDGCVIEPGAVISSNSNIGKSTFISSGAILNHNTTIGNYCHVNCGSVVGSNSNVSDFTKINYGGIYV